MTVPHCIIFSMRNISDTNCRENTDTHFMLNIFFLENRVFYENVEKI
jgi:hypothetical protein